jgi:uncharacterized damage-inducible protein DinB
MLVDVLLEIFERDLLKLKEEIEAYKHENDLWIVQKDISNSAGNLCLHLIGNLNHFIGATLGNTGYVRDRDKEFSSKNIPRAEMTEALDKTIVIVKDTLQKLSASDLEKDFPLEKHGRIVTTEHMLVHLLAHLSYHLGQVNYHRRLAA